MRVSFAQVFDVDPSGQRIVPKLPLKIGGATVSPGGVMGRGGKVSGIDLFALIGHDLEVEQEGGVLVYKRHY